MLMLMLMLVLVIVIDSEVRHASGSESTTARRGESLLATAEFVQQANFGGSEIGMRTRLQFDRFHYR
jgi:hypothetical protein